MNNTDEEKVTFVPTDTDIDSLIKEENITVENLEKKDFFALPPTKLVIPMPPVKPPKGDDCDKPSNDLDADFKEAQANLKELSDSLMDGVNTFAQIAQDSQHPKMYEILTVLAKTVADIQKDIVEIHVKKAKAAPKKEEEKKTTNAEPATVTNNTIVFAGTNAELDEIIKKQLSNGKK